MPTQPVPFVDCDVHHTGIYVPDVLAAVEFYTEKLGFTLAFTWGEPVTMAGVSLGEAKIFLQAGTANPAGCYLYFMVGDADALHTCYKENGVTIAVAPEDRQYGLRDFRIQDLNGYQLSFGHPIYNIGPQVPIERVDLSIRLERRLAALLTDLAAQKRMSVDSCLEEILLHTNEGVGPHTQSQLRYIAELKEKHGIDYDSHASYRFIETGPACDDRGHE